SRDLFLGPGGAAMRPDVRRLTFIKEEKGGYSKKYRVRDASGREWVVKIGKEAQSETSAVRLLYGLGYLTEINYLVPRVTIPGKGTFSNVRFEARPENMKDSKNVIMKEGNELRYAISDLGATFGHASTTPLFWRFTRSRNSPANYA